MDPLMLARRTLLPVHVDDSWDVLIGTAASDARTAPRLDLPALRRRTADLLALGVPLTLLLDLAEPAGPDSVARYGREGGDLSWLIAG